MTFLDFFKKFLFIVCRKTRKIKAKGGVKMKEKNCNEKSENRNEKGRKNQKSQKNERNNSCDKQADEKRY